MRIVKGKDEARRSVFHRTPPSGEFPPEVAKRVAEIFGEKLSPERLVDRILREVQTQGDKAIRDLERKIDSVDLEELMVSTSEMDEASASLPSSLLSALKFARERVFSFYNALTPPRSFFDFERGVGQMVLPLQRVGLYIPASYPSTVMMAAIPAKVAGVKEIIIITPPNRDGSVYPEVLAAANICGVDRVFKVGGAQAIFALALGTESIPQVDKICGPGNLLVQLAKRKVAGLVGIDGFYGPTETVIIADDSASPEICASDLVAQAEHDILASAILITTSERLALKVNEEVEAVACGIGRKEIALPSLEDRGGIAVVETIDEALELTNFYAPEHLTLLLKHPTEYIGRIRNAGGVFIGKSSAEAIGDYVVGPSHVMPTGGTARFSSPLGVDDFVKRTSLFCLSELELKNLTPAAMELAKVEGMEGHALSIDRRL
jgi:histidinol dehydrogenase